MKPIRLFPLLLLLTVPQAFGVPASLWGDLMRSGAKGDGTFSAAARAERVASELAQSGAARRAVGKDVGEITDAAARTRQVKALLQSTLYHPDPALIRGMNALSPDELETALVLARGSSRLVAAAPDVAVRARLLHAGGSDLVAAVGLHGDDLAREATRIDALVTAGKIPERISGQTALTRFAETMRRDDGGAWKFWQQHGKKVAAGGVVVAYLVNPELFHDAAGKITEEGTKRLIGIGVAVAKGAGEGGKKGMNEAWRTFKDQYLQGADAWAAWVGLGLTCWLLGLLLPRTRRWCMAPLAWLFRKPAPSHGQQIR